MTPEETLKRIRCLAQESLSHTEPAHDWAWLHFRTGFYVVRNALRDILQIAREMEVDQPPPCGGCGKPAVCTFKPGSDPDAWCYLCSDCYGEGGEEGTYYDIKSGLAMDDEA